MPWRGTPMTDDALIMKTPALICIELAFAIGIAIVLSIHLGWQGIITGLVICAIAIIIPVAAKEMGRFLDSSSGNYYRGSPRRCGRARYRRRPRSPSPTGGKTPGKEVSGSLSQNGEAVGTQ